MDLIYNDLSINLNTFGFLFYRIMQLLEQHIEALKNHKKEIFPNRNKRTFFEKKINRILRVFLVMIQKTYEASSFIFPYFDKILEVTTDFDILINLILIALQISHNKLQLVSSKGKVAKLFLLLSPFSKLFRHFDADYQVLRDYLHFANTQRPRDRITGSLREFVESSLKHGDLILKLTHENDMELLYEGEEEEFVSSISQKIFESENQNLTDSNRLYVSLQALGEAVFISHLLISQIDERLSDIILLAYSFHGINSCLFKIILYFS